MSAFKSKIRLLYDSFIEVTDDTFIVKDNNIQYRIVTSDGNISIPFNRYGVISDNLICVRKELTDSQYHLFMGNEHLFEGNYGEVLVKIKEMLHQLDIKYSEEAHSYQKEKSNMGTILYKVDLNKNFYRVKLRINSGRELTLVCNKDKKVICSYEQGFTKKYMYSENYLIAEKIEEDILDFSLLGQTGVVDRKTLKEAKTKFGRNQYVIFNTEGDIVYASDNKIQALAKDLFIENNKVLFKLTGKRREIIFDVGRYRRKYMEPMFDRYIVMSEEVPNGQSGIRNAVVYDIETNEVWRNVKVNKYNNSLGMIAIDDGTKTTFISIHTHERFILDSPVVFKYNYYGATLIGNNAEYEVINNKVVKCNKHEE